MFTDFNKIYYLEIDLKNLEVTYNSKALYANIDLDTSAMLIRLTLDEKPLDITGKIVTAYIKTSKDQNVTMQKCEILESNEGIIGLDFKNSALKAGTNVFFLEIKSENREIINSPLISYKVVEHFDIASGTEGENDITILRQLITEVDISKASVEALRDEVIEQETKREKAEADRKDNENSRAESENSRVQAETARATGEIAREQAESIREGNEVIRVNSESLRESSENARQQEEIKRSQSEALRVEAEEEREISYEEIKNDNSTFKEEINTIVNNYKEETDNVIDEYKTDIDETMSELDEKFGNAKVDYFGEEHLDVVDRLNSDFDNVHQRINDSSYLEYSGSNITADNTYYGLTKDLSIKNCRKVEISKAFEILGGEVGVTWYGAVAENENIDKLINMRVQIEEGTVATEFEPYQESIQEFQLTEPLRSLPNGVADEILEDGKLIRRVGKLILNGTENWTGFKNHFEDFDEFSGNIGNYKILQSNSIVNNFPQTNNHRIVTAGNTTYIRLPKGNVNNLNECKQWLSQNPTIVYYELAEPVVTKHNKSPNLKTFDGITHITSDNYLLPTISCKVPSNVQAVVTSLMKENKRLNSTISLMSLENEEIKKVNETQDELIDVSLCATDEIFMMIEPLLINTHSLSRKGENPIVNMYVAMVNRGLKNIEEVPNIYREQVKEIIG